MQVLKHLILCIVWWLVIIELSLFCSKKFYFLVASVWYWDYNNFMKIFSKLLGHGADYSYSRTYEVKDWISVAKDSIEKKFKRRFFIWGWCKIWIDHIKINMFSWLYASLTHFPVGFYADFWFCVWFVNQMNIVHSWISYFRISYPFFFVLAANKA